VVYIKCVSLTLCVLQIEVSELCFVPDAGASKDQCEAPLFKPVSAYDIQTESLFSPVMFSLKSLLTLSDTFSTIPLWRTSFSVSIVTGDESMDGSHSLWYLLEFVFTNLKVVLYVDNITRNTAIERL